MKPLVLDNSKLSVARQCLRKYHFRHVRNLTTALKEGPLNAGQAIHAAIAAYSKGASIEHCLDVALSSYKPQEWNEKEWRTPDRLVELLHQYLPLIKREEIAEDSKGEKLVEVSFAFPLKISEEAKENLTKCGFSEVIYAGKIDAIKRVNGLLHIVDYKTVSRLAGDKRKGEAKYIPSWYYDQYRLHLATMGYLYGASLWLEEPVYGVCIEGIGWDAYGSFAFSNSTFVYPESLLDEWLTSTTNFIENLIKLTAENKVQAIFNSDACFSFGRRCPFYELCRSGEGAWEEISKMFVVEEWSPLLEEEATET